MCMCNYMNGHCVDMFWVAWLVIYMHWTQFAIIHPLIFYLL